MTDIEHRLRWMAEQPVKLSNGLDDDLISPDRRVDVVYEAGRRRAVIDSLLHEKIIAGVSVFDLLVEEPDLCGPPNVQIPYDWTEEFPVWAFYLGRSLRMFCELVEKEEFSPEVAAWAHEHPSIAEMFREIRRRAAAAWAKDVRQLELPFLPMVEAAE